MVVAKTVKTIAHKCGLNINIAYNVRLLHDIGRYEGITGPRHIIAGIIL